MSKKIDIDFNKEDFDEESRDIVADIIHKFWGSDIGNNIERFMSGVIKNFSTSTFTQKSLEFKKKSGTLVSEFVIDNDENVYKVKIAYKPGEASAIIKRDDGKYIKVTYESNSEADFKEDEEDEDED